MLLLEPPKLLLAHDSSRTGHEQEGPEEGKTSDAEVAKIVVEA